MSKSKKSYSNEFKFKVALEMVKGDLTLAEVISKYQIPRSVAAKWKQQLLAKGADIFKSGQQGYRSQNEAEIEKLHATIGRLKVENDFLQAVSTKLKL